MGRHETIEISAHGGVRVVRMARAEQRNAINAQLHLELTEVWDEIAADDEARAVVLCGAGGVFSSGVDLDWLREVIADPLVRTRSMAEAYRLATGMLRFPLPIVAAVEKAALGLGSSVATLCDLVIMGESAFLADPHVAIGVVAGDGAVATWPFLTGMMRAKEYLFTGDRISADVAVKLGLAARAVPDDKVLDEAIALAQRLAAMPAAAMKATKRALNMHIERAAVDTLNYALAAETVTLLGPDILNTLDALERKAATAR
jgi:enoyl-CoA hydratase